MYNLISTSFPIGRFHPKLHEAQEEVEEQRRLVTATKKKCQRLTAEMQDLKLHLEEQMSRNNDLEKKQRR